MLIGGGGEKKTLRLVAQHADIWHSFSDLETLKRKTGILHEHCADGRPRSRRDRAVGRHAEGRSGRGRPSRLLDAGATLFTVGLGGPDYDDLEPLKAWIDWRDSLSG